MAEGYKWLALGYNVPINPSRNRVYVWRKLKEYGAEYFKQGVAVLPNNKTSLAHFKALVTKIREMGGEASIIEMRFLDSADDAEMVARFKNQSISDFTELLMDCARLMEDMRRHREMTEALEADDRLRKMIKRYSKLKSKDHFKAGDERRVNEGLDELAKAMKWSGGELKKLLDK